VILGGRNHHLIRIRGCECLLRWAFSLPFLHFPSGWFPFNPAKITNRRDRG
jgi:hypothetical protein